MPLVSGGAAGGAGPGSVSLAGDLCDTGAPRAACFRRLPVASPPGSPGHRPAPADPTDSAGPVVTVDPPGLVESADIADLVHSAGPVGSVGPVESVGPVVTVGPVAGETRTDGGDKRAE